MRRKLARMPFLFLAVIFAGSPVQAAAGSPAIVTPHRIADSFSGSSIDPKVWFYGADPSQVVLSEGGGHVTFDISASAGDGFIAGMGTSCVARGDFDARLSFDLVAWPLVDGVDLSLQAQGTPFNAYRASASWFDSYGAYLPPVGDVVPTSDITGSLRLARVGSTWTAYYLSQHRWVPIISGEGPLDDLGMTIAVFNIPGATVFGGNRAVIEVTDFTLKADGIVCPQA
jgi:hypothetical protein